MYTCLQHPRRTFGLWALGLITAGPLSAASFVYEGQLDDRGAPANGRYDVELSVYRDAELGATLGAPMVFNAVEVIEGRFRLDFEAPLRPHEAAWVALAVRDAGGGSFSAIPGRTKATLAPAAIGACWSSVGDSGSNPATNFIGTTDAQPFVVRTGNAQSLRIEPILTGSFPLTSNMIAGSSFNAVGAGVRGATIAGGGAAEGFDPDFFGEAPNVVSDHYGTVGGGHANLAGDLAGTAVDHALATVGGGAGNVASGLLSTIGGGVTNTASGNNGTVAGGGSNRATGAYSSVGGGDRNVASGANSTVAGGLFNAASGQWATVSGGALNCAGPAYSWASGRNAKVRPATNPGGTGACDGLTYPGGAGDSGTFIWADSQSADFVSTGPNQFLLRAQGGVGVNTNAPVAALTVQSADQWNPTVGNGWGDVKLGNATVGLGIGVATSGGGAGAVRLWARGGNEQIIFTNATQYPTSILSLEPAGRVGIRRAAATNALEVEGDASKTTAGAWLANSDGRIKTDVAPIENALDRLMRIRPVGFRYDAAYLAAHPDIADKRYYNVIAQEYAEVFPEAVQGSGEYLGGTEKTDANEVLQVDFHPATVLTVAAVQELALRLEATERDNAALKAQLAELQATVAALMQAGRGEAR